MLAFLSPAFLLGASAAAVPIFLHLFRRQTENLVAFSAVRFLRRAPVEQTRRRRLRELLLLALRVSALVLLALAFARPYFANAQATAGPLTVIAVDRSFSMSAPGTLAEAQSLAKEAVASAPANHRVALIAFDDAAQVVTAPTSNRGAALAALDHLSTGFGATRYGAALARAAELLASGPGRVLVVTDLQESGWAHRDRGGIATNIPVEVAEVGARPSNLAVVEARAEADAVVALVRNFGPTGYTGIARLALDGRQAGETTFSVAPGLGTTVRFPASVPPRGDAAVRIEDDRGYRGDDVRYVLLDPPEPTEILLVTASGGTAREAFYLERALLSGGGASRFRLRQIGGVKLAELTEESLRSFPAILLVGTRGLDRRSRDQLRGYVERGGGLLVVAGPDTEVGALADLLSGWIRLSSEASAGSRQALSLAPVDGRHPIFRAFGAATTTLGAVRFTGTLKIVEGGASRVIGRFSDGTPALVECSAGEGRVLLLASDLNSRWNDFPLQPPFVPFVHEMTRYVSGAREAVREVLIGDLPDGIEHRPGVQTLVGAGRNRSLRPAGRRVAVNVDPLESDPSRLTADRFMAAVNRLNETAAVEALASAKAQEEKQGLWQYGLLLMVVGLVLEGVLGSRMG